MQTIGALVAPTPAEIQLRDLRLQTELKVGQVLAVDVLDRTGVLVKAEIHLAEKWSTRGFELQLRCPACSFPCRVLRNLGVGFLCTRCAPRATKRHTRKNTTDWKYNGGEETDRLIRSLQNAGSNSGMLDAQACKVIDEAVERLAKTTSLSRLALDVVERGEE